MLESAVVWLTETIFQLGYTGIVLLMALESSFFPFPSEVVLPPAGYLAAQGRMNAWLALGAGVSGSLIGAVFNYYLALRLGRPILHRLLERYGKFVLLRVQSLDKAEKHFREHGEISTFVGRLIPGIRQLISLPAGLARMNLARFSAYTALGAGIWCAVLTYIGWFLGKNSDVLLEGMGPEVHRYTRMAFLVLVPVLAALILVYVVRHRRVNARAAQSE